MKVWSVDMIHNDTVSHGFEVVAICSSEEKANAYKAQCEVYRAKAIVQDKDRWGTRDEDMNSRHGYGYAVQEWDVDEYET